jgi:hypothetical protein
MSKVLMESLKLDLPALAEMIRAKGRGRDTMLAHITPKEAALLKRRGGRGSINPDTGLPEFEDDFGGDFGGDFGPTYEEMGYTPAPEQTGPTYNELGYTPSYDTPSVDTTPTAYDNRDVGLIEQPGVAPVAPVYDVIGPQGAFTSYTGGVPAAPGVAAIPPTQVGKPYTPGMTTPSGKEREGLFGDAGKYLAGALGANLGAYASNAGRVAAGTAVAGGLTAANLARTRQAQQQAQESKQELQAVGTPYQSQGKELIRAAQTGELTPVNQQIIAAARAQANQAVATRGGVGLQQAQNSIADLTARLLQNQYDLGLKVMNIGDNYVTGAIRTGLQADQMINQANQQFYSTLAQMAAPFLLGQQPIYQVTPGRS